MLDYVFLCNGNYAREYINKLAFYMCGNAIAIMLQKFKYLLDEPQLKILTTYRDFSFVVCKNSITIDC